MVSEADGSDDDDHTYPCKCDFVAQVMEATNAVLRIVVIVVLDETEAFGTSAIEQEDSRRGSNIPFAETGVEVNDRLRAPNVAEASTPVLEHLISSLRQEATDVDISLAALVLQSTVQWLQR